MFNILESSNNRKVRMTAIFIFKQLTRGLGCSTKSWFHRVSQEIF